MSGKRTTLQDELLGRAATHVSASRVHASVDPDSNVWITTGSDAGARVSDSLAFRLAPCGAFSLRITRSYVVQIRSERADLRCVFGPSGVRPHSLFWTVASGWSHWDGSGGCIDSVKAVTLI